MSKRCSIIRLACFLMRNSLGIFVRLKLKITKCAVQACRHPLTQFSTRAHVPSYEFLTNAADKQAYDQLLAEDAKARAMDNFQRILVMADNGTKFMLLSYCAYFPSSNPTNVDFIRGDRPGCSFVGSRASTIGEEIGCSGRWVTHVFAFSSIREYTLNRESEVELEFGFTSPH